MEGRASPGSTALSGSRVRSVSATRHRGTRVVRQVGAALATRGALAVLGRDHRPRPLGLDHDPDLGHQSLRPGGSRSSSPRQSPRLRPRQPGQSPSRMGGVNIAGCVSRASRLVLPPARPPPSLSDRTPSPPSTAATRLTQPAPQPLSHRWSRWDPQRRSSPASVNPSVSGQTVTYTATVSSVAPASGTRPGTVAFQDGGVVIASCAAKAVAVNGTATCAIAYTGPGTHTITAIYSGDANFTTSTASAITQTVNLGPTAVALSSSANPSSTGANVTFTANVTATAPASGARTGTVDFQVGGVNIAGCSAQVVPALGRPHASRTL